MLVEWLFVSRDPCSYALSTKEYSERGPEIGVTPLMKNIVGHYWSQRQSHCTWEKVIYFVIPDYISYLVCSDWKFWLHFSTFATCWHRAALNTPPEALLKGCCATVFVCRLGPVAFIAGVLRKINKALYTVTAKEGAMKKRERMKCNERRKKQENGFKQLDFGRW